MRKGSVLFMLLIVVSIAKAAVINRKKIYENYQHSIQESRKL
jgi:hypothetical protein